jgi:hypothetical protein
MGGNEGVERADGLAASRQGGSDHTKPTSSGPIEGHDLDSLNERADQAVELPREPLSRVVD